MITFKSITKIGIGCALAFMTVMCGTSKEKDDKKKIDDRLNNEKETVHETLKTPLIPLQFDLHYWDHHWFQWLPQHPEYESVEVMSRERGSGESPLVWFFFTERDPPKQQHHYFNDESIANGWEGAHYSPITYQHRGTPGDTPLELHVQLKNTQGTPIEWRMSFGEKRSLRRAGLTDQTGHGQDEFFLVFFREHQQSTRDAVLTIGEEEFSFPDDPDIMRKFGFAAAYSHNVYTATIPFTSFEYELNGSTIETDKRFEFEVSHQEGKQVWHGSSSQDGDGSWVAWTNDNQQIERIIRKSVSGKKIEIGFTPPLPAAHEINNNYEGEYELSLDEFSGLIEGQVKAEQLDDQVQLIFFNKSPDWTTDYNFQAIVRTGNTIEVTVEQYEERNPSPEN